MNRQEVFNEVYEKLSKQSRKSMAYVEGYAFDLNPTFGCAYRSPNGDKCAIGHLIPDNLYSEEIEGLYVDDNKITSILIKMYPDMTDEDFTFLSELQEVHDNTPGDIWFISFFHKNMKHLAIKWNLEFNH